MKKKILTTGYFLFISLLANSAIWVANNNPGAASGTNVFTGSTALQDALSNVSLADGDIIYVVPSIINYGNIVITKGITLFGVGIRAAKDLGAKSIVTRIDIDASNVRVSGMISSEFVYLGDKSNNVTLSNIVLENSRIQRLIQTSDATVDLSNVLIRNNLIIGFSFSVQFYTVSNVTFSNNVVYTSTSTSWKTVKANTVNFSNNLFISDGAGYTFNEVINCVFDHNIFIGTRAAVGSNSTGNVWDDNLSFGGVSTTFSVGSYANTSNNGNVENQDPLLVNMPLGTTWSDAYDFSLQVGSPAININGTDIGPSGGAIPFNFEGNLLPLIQSVTLPAVIPVGSNLPVTIKAKGN